MILPCVCSALKKKNPDTYVREKYLTDRQFDFNVEFIDLPNLPFYLLGNIFDLTAYLINK